MVILGAIIVVVLMNITIFTAYYMEKSPLKFLVLSSSTIATFIWTAIYMTCNIVPAIEVYRGNTELVITEKTENGLVIERDSTVVLKNKK